jgi:hypothetical protein
MLANHDPDRNIEDLTDTEIYDAIRYLEPQPRSAKEMAEDADDREEDNSVVIYAFLYIALLGCLAFVWLR